MGLRKAQILKRLKPLKRSQALFSSSPENMKTCLVHNSEIAETLPTPDLRMKNFIISRIPGTWPISVSSMGRFLAHCKDGSKMITLGFSAHKGPPWPYVLSHPDTQKPWKPELVTTLGIAHRTNIGIAHRTLFLWRHRI